MTVDRTERDVLEELTPEARKLLKRVLEIEREKLHVSAAAPTLVEEIRQAVLAVLP
jgi:DNA-binding MarR family transcriptional regulator